MIQCEGIPVRGLSLFVFIVEGEALQCQYERAGVAALWVAHQGAYLFHNHSSHCNRGAKGGGAPHVGEKIKL